MAGFQPTLYGRFWVIPEGHEHLEQIGLVLHATEDLGFVAER